jgi:MSHA biogenesis protein MshQ
LIAQTPIDQIISVSINPACSANISGRELQVATQCENPASCQSGQLRLDDNVSPSTDNFNNTGIFFDNSGVAQINANRLQYDDAGQIRLLFRDFSTVDNLSLASGQTNSFISIPMGFETIYTEPESLLAGMEYPIAYRAVGAEGRVTPNYQPSVLQLRANKIFPGNDQGRQGTVSLGAAAVLTTDDGASDFNNVANDALGFQDGMTQDLTISYSEAGDFELTIQDSDYLMSGSVIPSEVGAFGRFLPAYLSVVSEDSMIAQCTDTFNYFGQNIGYIQNADITLSGQPNVVVHPVDVTGVQIHNFDGETGFYTPDDSQLGNVTYTESTNTTIVERVTAGRSELLNPELYDGEFAIYIRDNELRFPKSDLPAAPLVAGTVTMLVPAPLFSNSINNHELCIRDEFNGECVGVGIGSDNSNGINVRWGRLSLINVFGSELETLLVPFRAEYYDGSSFITNIDDSCTTISLDLNADDLTVDSTLITMANTGANGSSSFSAITLSGGNSLSGLDGLYVSPPGEMAEVTIQIDTATPLIGVDWQDYLNFDWDGNGVIQSGIDEPSVTILFGQYRGNDRIIHWREVFNLA